MNTRIMRAVHEGLRRRLQSNAMYLGRKEYDQLRAETKAYLQPGISPSEVHEGKATYAGLKVFLVAAESHFAVVFDRELAEREPQYYG
jgi:hypothetical protein